MLEANITYSETFRIQQCQHELGQPQLRYSSVSLSGPFSFNSNVMLEVCFSVSLPLLCVCVPPPSTPPPEDMDEVLQQTREMNLYCHFARGLGEARYMAAESWSSLNKTLLEVLDSYNEVNATLNLVLFEDAMAHM